MGSGSQQMEEEMGRAGHSACSMGLSKRCGDSGSLGCPRDTSVNSHCQKECFLAENTET